MRSFSIYSKKTFKEPDYDTNKGISLKRFSENRDVMLFDFYLHKGHVLPRAGDEMKLISRFNFQTCFSCSVVFINSNIYYQPCPSKVTGVIRIDSVQPCTKEEFYNSLTQYEQVFVNNGMAPQLPLSSIPRRLFNSIQTSILTPEVRTSSQEPQTPTSRPRIPDPSMTPVYKVRMPLILEETSDETAPQTPNIN
jgi:hypothetical protein